MGYGGRGSVGASCLNFCTRRGDLIKIFFPFAINLSTSGLLPQTSSAALCRACARHVTCIIFGYSNWSAFAAFIMYGTASLYEEKHILSFYSIWLQQIHCIIENNSNGGVIHSFQRFTCQQEYFSRLLVFKGAHNNICYESTIHVTGFIYGDPYFVFSETISYLVDCILVPKKQDSSFLRWVIPVVLSRCKCVIIPTSVGIITTDDPRIN